MGKPHRALGGHPWVYSSEVTDLRGSPAAGDVVLVRDPRGRPLGSGLYSTSSQIAVRLYSQQAEDFSPQLVAQRIAAALDYREQLARPGLAAGARPDAERLIWSEADGLPGLVVDRYGDTLVVQALCQGIDRRLEWITPLLAEQTGARVGIARHDASARRLEGLPLEKKILWPASDAARFSDATPPPPSSVNLHGVTFSADLWNGQKTGLYLDQVDNYAAIARHAAGRRVLDAFCHQGAFALMALRHGATSALGIDQSAEALAAANTAAQTNGLAERAQWQVDNAFDALRALEKDGAQFDLIVLDPPSFTKTRAQVQSALRGYHELHVRALRLLAPGGLLFTFTCSHAINAELWEELLARAVADTRMPLRLARRLGQSADHPVRVGVPETEYLRGCILEKT